ncbi:biotin synthase BioB [Leptolyngbya sp. FACHB-711]|uniref:biotin synthase BioB n=1 Tax=unclassified Leptolyngbya TaxID=2650499 RepID=UPI001685BC6A|nr:biotin synthase BioB [Leptolyngbya sp. FACHB-711]MBD1851208.1 biotin synthase BioB [Cyanobacteria bacterium FACHB-502]MBD2023965.1 biotin synthase BioB [Leptolyngbya sp. FACHB-711]
MSDLRHNWTTEEILDLLQQPLLDLVFQAQTVHRRHNPSNCIQLATLLSVKTGGCPENCSYCPQSAHYETTVEKQPTLTIEEVVSAAHRAKELGATRFCMGWAWREIREGVAFEAMLEIVRQVRSLGLEACVTAGMLTDSQAERLAAAGLSAYNHNLDTSPEFYDQIITTRTYGDRLETLDRVRKAGITVCCGGIIGMGESLVDRARMLQVLATLTPHPESVPINALVAVSGTPLEEQQPIDPLELVRMCAVARILMPQARVRLSAGRTSLSREAQVLCFLAGANSIFYGEKLLTTANPDQDADRKLLEDIGAVPLEPFVDTNALSIN